jgi:hypothetical protein
MICLFMFLAGMQFCLAIVLVVLGHAGEAGRCLFGAGGCLFMAWVWAKYPPGADSATERKS